MIRSASFVIVGAGIHGLSTAYHLAQLLSESGRSPEEVLVLDKGRVGGGATGISGGIVRNFYLSMPMNELVRQSVEIFEIDPASFGFHQVGYVAVVPEAQAAELEQIATQHARIGYLSELSLESHAVRRRMRSHFADWRAEGAAALHEPRGGWADANATVATFASMARSLGVEIVEAVELHDVDFGDGAATRLHTSRGLLECETLVVAPGPWARDIWPMLKLAPDGPGGASTSFFHYWQIREGQYLHPMGIDPRSPVVHIDADGPLIATDEGALVSGSPWGIYFRPAVGGSIACGGVPVPLEFDCELDPYGPSHPRFGVDPDLDATVTAALSFVLGRFSGPRESWTCSSFGAPACFTPDGYPVVGFVRDNVYVVLDANHGFKLLALGKLAAEELVGEPVAELERFRLARFADAAVHPKSASPYPWT